VAEPWGVGSARRAGPVIGLETQRYDGRVATSSPLERELRPLLDNPVEDLATEMKDWLDLSTKIKRADLARELIALANHGGGYVLFGFQETVTGWSPSGACPYDLKCYSADEINNILKAHAEPVFECYTHHLASTKGHPHVVVKVPGGHTMPIRSRGGPSGSRLTDHMYYIRRPGPESAPPDNGREWDELISRCVDNNHERNLESFRRIINMLRGSADVAASIAEMATGASDPLSIWIDESLERFGEVGGGG
jgi:predicted HTH transcriptional regulator